MESAGDAVPIAELLDERRYMLDVASCMVGTAAAECAVDEAYRRWFGLSETARGRIASPRSWLAETVGDICLAWPATASGALPSARRAVFAPVAVFGMAWGEAAGPAGRSEPERAELADRARRSLSVRRSRPASAEEHDAVVRAVREACAHEDAVRLGSLLHPDATAFFDGGGKVRTLVRPVHGGEPVTRSLLTLLARRPRVTLTTQSVNGRTGLVARYDRQVAAVISLDIADHRAVQAWIVLNPDKLRAWNHPRHPTSDA